MLKGWYTMQSFYKKERLETIFKFLKGGGAECLI